MLHKFDRLIPLLLALLVACSQAPSNLEPEQPQVPLSVLGRQAPFVPGEIIIKFRSDSSEQTLNTSSLPGIKINRVRALGQASGAQLYRAAVTSKEETLELIQTLAARSDVLYAHPNYLLKPFATPNDPFYSNQWHYRAVNLPAAWDINKGSANVRVAVLDTGIATGHPDFAGKLRPGYDFVSDTWSSGDGDGRDNDPTDPGGSYHGTHVAGTIGAATDNSVGVAGVSWGSRILPVRVLGEGGGSLADVIDGIVWSAGLDVPGVPRNANPAQVLNLSLGGPFLCSDVPALQDAFNKVNAAGAVVVVAAGNGNSDAKGESPASCRGVITVGATNLKGNRATYSNYGSRIDVMAPGGDLSQDTDRDGNPDGVLSTVRDSGGKDTYAYMDGTSMASPHVAGVIALMKSVKPSLTWTQARDILKRTARPISHSSCSVGCGAGLIDAAAALRSITTTTPATYTVNFTSSNVPVGRVISSVSLGRGITSSTGTLTSKVGIFAKRSDKTGNMAMVTGSAKHLIISKDGSSQTSYAKGGYMDFRFNNFGTGRVEATSLRIKNTTTTGGSVKVYRGTNLLKTVSVPKTGSGVTKTLTLNVANASLVKVTLTGPGAVDKVVFTASQ